MPTLQEAANDLHQVLSSSKKQNPTHFADFDETLKNRLDLFFDRLATIYNDQFTVKELVEAVASNYPQTNKRFGISTDSGKKILSDALFRVQNYVPLSQLNSSLNTSVQVESLAKMPGSQASRSTS